MLSDNTAKEIHTKGFGPSGGAGNFSIGKLVIRTAGSILD